MAIAKVVELTSTSTEGFQHAVESGVARASKSINNIQGAWVNDMKVVVANGSVTEYRVNMRVTFLVED